MDAYLIIMVTDYLIRRKDVYSSTHSLVSSGTVHTWPRSTLHHINKFLIYPFTNHSISFAATSQIPCTQSSYHIINAHPRPLYNWSHTLPSMYYYYCTSTKTCQRSTSVHPLSSLKHSAARDIAQCVAWGQIVSANPLWCTDRWAHR